MGFFVSKKRATRTISAPDGKPAATELAGMTAEIRARFRAGIPMTPAMVQTVLLLRIIELLEETAHGHNGVHGRGS